MAWVGILQGSTLPLRMSPGAAAYDFASAEDAVITPGSTRLVDLNLRLAIPPGVYLQLQSRSGLALRGVTTVGGVIDSDYRGPIKVILHNSSDQNVIIAKGQRVTSGVFLPTVSVMFHAADVLPPTVRGSAGFGSSD